MHFQLINRSNRIRFVRGQSRALFEFPLVRGVHGKNLVSNQMFLHKLELANDICIESLSVLGRYVEGRNTSDTFGYLRIAELRNRELVRHRILVRQHCCNVVHDWHVRAGQPERSTWHSKTFHEILNAMEEPMLTSNPVQQKSATPTHPTWKRMTVNVHKFFGD